MASPASSPPPTESTQEDAARQSLIGISQSVPAAGEALSVKLPNGRMDNGPDDVGAEKYRSMLMSISDLSPDARQQPMPPFSRSNGVA